MKVTINKLHTSKEKESSSLKNQKKLFIRRPDITPVMRLELSIAGLGPTYRTVTIAELCSTHKVSHEFIYALSRNLRQQGISIFGKKEKPAANNLEKLLESMRFFLEGKMETQGALHGLSNFSANWGGVYTSTCFISQTLEVAGSLLSTTLKGDQLKRVIYLCDEVYSGNAAILVTIDAKSMAVLDIKLLDKPLDGAAWKARFIALEQANYLPSELVKDGGKAMQAAEVVLPKLTIVRADTFHGTSHRLGLYRNRLIRLVNDSMKKEEEIQGNISRAKSAEMISKQQGKLAIQRAKTAKLLDLLDWFEQAYFLLLQQLRPFTSQGIPRDKQEASQTISFALEALALLPLKGLKEKTKYIESLVQNGTLLSFLDKVPVLYNKWAKQLDPQTTWLWMLYWLWWKKSFQTHSPLVQAHAKKQAQAAKQLLEEHYLLNHQLEKFEQIRCSLFENLDTIVQASSLVETFNSILKPFINSARGQVNQPLLNLVAFYHNHRVFNTRSKRGGFAPIELLNGNSLDKPWIDLLMDKVKAAFIKYKVTSLKELHAILTKDLPRKLEDFKNSKPSKTIAVAA